MRNYNLIKMMKNIVITLLILISGSKLFAQAPKPIYFLVDTVTISKENRIVEAGIESTVRYYSFFCRCIRTGDRNIAFTYLERDRNNVLAVKPTVPYISWKDLSQILWLEGTNFDEKYALHIIETLPGEKYLRNKVKMVVSRTAQ